MKKHQLLLFVSIFFCLSCHTEAKEINDIITISKKNKTVENSDAIPFDTAYKTIHIYVALCDNKYQGIVPVPEKIGNGQNPNSNLYWGCGYGIRTYFKKSKDWKFITSVKPDQIRLERLIFKHVSKKYYLVADAYDGQHIKKCTQDFLEGSCGKSKETIQVDSITTIGIAGNSKLLAYIGHNGLMDFQLTEKYVNTDNKKRDLIILACYSKSYFSQHLKDANVTPLVWTTGLMCPEAYTVHDAIRAYLNQENNEGIRTKAALAYSTYQKCGEKAARNLLVTGW